MIEATQTQPMTVTPFARVLFARVPIAWVQIAVILTFLGIQPFLRMVDPDFWWHLRTGQLIVESGIPRHDPFSWTALGKPWVTHEWLSEAIIYGVESTLGYAANALLFGASALSALSLMFLLARKRGVGRRLLVVLLFIAGLMFSYFMAVRPQVFSWLLFAIFVFLIEEHTRKADKRVWMLAPLMMLWVNLHLGFIFGLCVVGAWTASSLVRWTFDRDIEPLTPLAVSGLCLLAAMANPTGPGILLYPFRYLNDSHSLGFIAEWQRPSPLNPLMAPLFISIALLILSLLSRHRPSLFLCLLTLPVVALGLQAERNMPFVALLLLPVVGPTATGQWQRLSHDSTTRMAVWQGLAVVLLVVFAASARGVFAGHGLSFASPSAGRYPSGGAAYSREHLADYRLYNEYSWGGYLIYELYPNVPVFIDGRTDFYRSQLLDDYVKIGRLEPGWQESLDGYGINAVLLRKDARLARALREDSAWEEVFTGPIESVLVRRQ